MSISEEHPGYDGPRMFEVRVDTERDRATVTPVGEIDLLTAPALQRAVEELLDRGAARVVVDLSEVPFLDSQGIRALLAAHRKAQECGAEVSLLVPNHVTRRALEICGLLERLDVLP